MNNLPSYVADRKSLFSELDKFLESHRTDGKKLAILLINLNHFRKINIAYGFSSGDELLQQFSERLRKLARKNDYIARMGSSEFVLVLPEILNEGHAILAANKLLSSLDEPFELNLCKHKSTADMGVAIYPDHSEDMQGLLQKAEIALMDARKGIQPYSIYSNNSKEVDINAWDIEVELENAQDRDEFEIYFQPQISLQTGELFGAEALVRWNNKERGFVRPDIFIPLAEQTGQIHDITWWTINAALRLINDWPEKNSALKVAVNISTKVLLDPGLVDSVRSALQIWRIDHSRLTLEITESALMEDMSTSFIALDELKALGLNISIDDFGTGYSSMAYFKYIPADELKIDQSFVCYMLENSMDQHIVKTVTEMAHGFGIKVVAEGVENKETLDALNELGCDIAQGYYLAKPMPQEKFIVWLIDYRSD